MHCRRTSPTDASQTIEYYTACGTSYPVAPTGFIAVLGDARLVLDAAQNQTQQLLAEVTADPNATPRMRSDADESHDAAVEMFGEVEGLLQKLQCEVVFDLWWSFLSGFCSDLANGAGALFAAQLVSAVVLLLIQMFGLRIWLVHWSQQVCHNHTYIPLATRYHCPPPPSPLHFHPYASDHSIARPANMFLLSVAYAILSCLRSGSWSPT